MSATRSLGRHALLLIVAATLAVGPAHAQSARQAEMGYAASEGDVRVVTRLLDGGFDVNETWGIHRHFALLKAAEWGHLDAVRLLLARGADPLLEDASGRTARWWARNGGHPAIVRLLEDAEARTRAAAPPAPPTAPAPVAPAPVAPAPVGTLAVGAAVQFSTSGGERWRPGVVERVGAPGSDFEGTTLVYDPALDDRHWVEASALAARTREPSWTAFFVGDWELNTGMAVTTRSDGRDVYQIVTGGLRLPPLRVHADGSYLWRASERGGERVIRGRWVAREGAPGIVLLAGARGADWTLANRTTRSTARAIGRDEIRLTGAASSLVGHRVADAPAR